MDDIQIVEHEESLAQSLRIAMMALENAGKTAHVLYGEEGDIRQEAMRLSLGACVLLDNCHTVAQIRRNNDEILRQQGLRVVK